MNSTLAEADPRQSTPFGASGYTLDDVQLFQGSVLEVVCRLLADCPVLRLPPGVPVVEPHDQACLYVVLRGALSCVPEDAPAASSDGVRRILRGECVGELSVLDEEASSELISATEESDLLVIDAARLWKLVDESNGVARNLLRMLSFRVRAANAQLRRRRKVGEFYRQLSMADALTGLHNRAWLSENLPALIDAAHALNQPLSLVMVDLDRFKTFNDEHGHVLGDRALTAAAQAICGGLRPTDFAARYGGEELTVILPGATREAALHIAQRLCERVRQVQVFSTPEPALPHLTASFGVATLEPGQQPDALIAAADAALYRAKEGGRDRVA